MISRVERRLGAREHTCAAAVLEGAGMACSTSGQAWPSPASGLPASPPSWPGYRLIVSAPKACERRIGVMSLTV